MKLSDARLAELEARWKPVGNVVVSGAEAVALLAEVREGRSTRTVSSVKQLEDLPVGSIIAELSEPDAPALACKAVRGWQFLGGDPERRYISSSIYEDGHPSLRLVVLYEAP